MTRRRFMRQGSELVAFVASIGAIPRSDAVLQDTQVLTYQGRTFELKIGREYSFRQDGSVIGPGGETVNPKD